MALNIIGGAHPIKDTQLALTTGQIQIAEYQISDRIYLKVPSATPFCRFGEMIKNEIAGTDDTIHWYEDVPIPENDTCTGSVGVAAALVTLTTPKLWMMYDTIFWKDYGAAEAWISGPINYTTGVAPITWVSAPTGAIPPGAACIRIGNAFPQNSTVAPGPTTKEAQYSNYFQDMRMGIGMTDQYREGKFRVTPGDWDYQWGKVETMFDMETEKTHLFGQGSLSTDSTSGSPVGTMEGLYNWASVNSTPVGGILTRPVWDDFLTTALTANYQQEAEGNWWLLASNRILRQITEMAYPFQRINQPEASKLKWGMQVSEYTTPVGQTITLKRHPLLDYLHFDDLAFFINVTPQNMRFMHHSIFSKKRYTSLLSSGASRKEEFFRHIRTFECKGPEINTYLLEDVHAA